MKKKDEGLLSALNDIMGTGPQEAPEEPTESLQEAHKRPTMEAVRLRLPKADLAALDALAALEGGNRSVLIRRAIKDLLRKAGK